MLQMKPSHSSAQGLCKPVRKFSVASSSELQSLRVPHKIIFEGCRIHELHKNQPCNNAFMSLMAFTASLSGVSVFVSIGDMIAVGVLASLHSVKRRGSGDENECHPYRLCVRAARVHESRTLCGATHISRPMCCG